MSSNNHQQGVHKHGYIPSLVGKNPLKKQNEDWWDELCKKYEETNYFPKEKPKLVDKSEDED